MCVCWCVLKLIFLFYFLFEDVCLGFGVEIVVVFVDFFILVMVVNKFVIVLKKFVIYWKVVWVSDIYNWLLLEFK